MRHTETLPNWALRLTERSAQRRTKNRITRWMKLSTPTSRVDAKPDVPEARTFEPSCNDNLLHFPVRAAI